MNKETTAAPEATQVNSADDFSMGYFKQPKLSGYRQLTEPEALVINEVKSLGNKIGVMLDSLQGSTLADPRWVAIARTTLQTGFMQLVRAVAKPEGF